MVFPLRGAGQLGTERRGAQSPSFSATFFSRLHLCYTERGLGLGACSSRCAYAAGSQASEAPTSLFLQLRQKGRGKGKDVMRGASQRPIV